MTFHVKQMKPETKLYNRIKDNLDNCYITKLENRGGALGVPDLLIGFNSPCKFIMVELKAVKTGYKVKLSPHQVSFQVRHIKLPVFTIVETKDNLLVYSAKQAVSLVEQGIKCEPLFVCDLEDIQWHMLRYSLVSNG